LAWLHARPDDGMSASRGSISSFVVYSSGGQFEFLTPAAKAILGEYAEDGENHGRKVYRRKRTTSQVGLPEVVLFFWDARDGKDLAGWWFGDEVGGGQVWSRNAQMSVTPPMKGWRCPVDGPQQKHVLCVPKIQSAAERAEATERPQAPRNRPDAATEVGAPTKKSIARAHTMVLASKLDEEASPAIQALTGEYIEQGMNHGHKAFLKKGDNGNENVWLYYWDQRDGSEFGGWWLGNRIGGAQVYARAQQHSAMPPAKGWHIPSDGSVMNDVSVSLKIPAEELDMPEEERLKKSTSLVVDMEGRSEKALQTSESVLNGSGAVLEEGVRAVHELLESQVETLADAASVVSGHIKAGKAKKSLSEGTEAELGLLGERLQAVLGRVGKEAANAKQQLQKVERESAEHRDGKAIEESLPLAMEAVVQAEMAMDAAGTDEAAAQARVLIANAKGQVSAILEAAQLYAPQAQKLALTEFNALLFRCELAEKKAAVWDVRTLSGSDNADDIFSKEFEDVDDYVVDGEYDGEEDVSLDDVVEPDPSFPEERVLKQCRGRVADVEAGAKDAIETAQVVFKEHVGEKGSKLVLDLLREHYVAVRQTQKFIELVECSKRSMTPLTAEAVKSLEARLQVVGSHISQELGRAKRHIARLRRYSNDDHNSMEGPPPTAQDVVARAEEAVAAISLVAGGSGMELGAAFAGEYGDDAGHGMDETQAAADKAQSAILFARRHLDMQIRAARGLTGTDEQKVALADIASLRRRLIEAQKGLNPYKRARLELEQELKGKQELEGLSRQLTSIAADVGRIGTVLAGQSLSSDEVQSAEVTLHSLLSNLSKALTSLEHKGRGMRGSHSEQVGGLQERGKEVRMQIEEVKVKAQEQKQRLLVQSALQQVESEVKKTEEWVGKIAKAEEPWSGGVEVVPDKIANPALESCNVLADEAESAVKAAKSCVTEKLEHVRQLAEGTLLFKMAKEITTLEARVDDVALRVMQLKIDTFARKTKLLFPRVIELVGAAEAKVRKVADAAGLLGEDNVETVKDDELRKVCKETLACERDAAIACAEARTALSAKRDDPKFKESPSFRSQLLKLDGRLASTEKELAAQRAAALAANESKKTLQVQRAEVEKLTSAIGELELLTLPLGDERPSNEAEESMARSMRIKQDMLKKWITAAETMVSEAPHVSLRIAMARLLECGRELQVRLDDAKAITRERYEVAMCRVLLSDGRSKLQKVEDAIAKAEVAESPFLRGADTLTPEQSSEAMMQCDAAGTSAQDALVEAQSFCTEQRAEVAGYSCIDSEMRKDLHALGELSKRAEVCAQKLARFTRNMESRKRLAPQQAENAPPAKVARTEAGVPTLPFREPEEAPMDVAPAGEPTPRPKKKGEPTPRPKKKGAKVTR